MFAEAQSLITAHVELPVSLVTPPAGPNPGEASASTSTPMPPANTLTKEKKRKHHLTTATDPLLAELQDLNFSAVGKKLNQVARRLDEDYKVRPHAATASTITLTPTLAQTPGEDGGAAARLRWEIGRPAVRASVIALAYVGPGGMFSEDAMLTAAAADTGLSEMLVPMTRTEEFNRSLEIQQSKSAGIARDLAI